MCRTSFTDHSSAEYFHSSNCVGTCTDLALKNSCKQLQQLHRQNPLQITPPAMLRSTLEEKKKMWTLSLAEVKLRKCVHKDASEWGRTKSLPTSLAPLCQGGAELQRCLIRRPKSRERTPTCWQTFNAPPNGCVRSSNTNPASCIHICPWPPAMKYLLNPSS